FYPADERARVAVDEWLFWQVGNLGPIAGQAHHFRLYAPEAIAYAVDRFTDECNRLYGVMNRRLAEQAFLAGDAYTTADMAWCWERQGQDPGQFPHVKRWLDVVRARPAVHRGMHIRVEAASQVDMRDPQVRAVLFNQRAR